jgi:hypothetical protein
MQCPIDKTTLNAIRKGIATLQEAERQIILAESAGIDVIEEKARCLHLQEVANKIVAAYDPILRGLGKVTE